MTHILLLQLQAPVSHVLPPPWYNAQSLHTFVVPDVAEGGAEAREMLSKIIDSTSFFTLSKW